MRNRIIILAVIVLFMMGFMFPGLVAASPVPSNAVEGVPESLTAEGISAESWQAMQAQMPLP